MGVMVINYFSIAFFALHNAVTMKYAEALNKNMSAG